MNKKKTALLSVYDKSGIDSIAMILAEHGYRILSTGGTAHYLRKAGIDVVEIADYTGVSESEDGRVKTLHPKIFSGILEGDEDQRQNNSADMIDLIIVNLYPFQERVSKATEEHEAIELIDVGGVALMRAAAKNYRYVTVIGSIESYDSLRQELEANQGFTTLEFRRKMAWRAFCITTAYDACIRAWFEDDDCLDMPNEITLCGKKVEDLRIGENPHQRGALYSLVGKGEIPLKQLSGKALSYNNIVDIEASIKIVSEFDAPAAVVIKHGNPCGVALGSSGTEACARALSCDPRSSFGGVIALNVTLSAEVANLVGGMFVEAIVAPEFEDEAIGILRLKKNLRIIKCPLYSAHGKVFKSVLSCGFLVQDSDSHRVSKTDLKLVTSKSATESELDDLLFAWRVCKHVRSNAIVLARNGLGIGVGAGQTSRVDSVEIALRKAGNCEGAVLASDAFFPFADGVQCAISSGVVAVVQPGGSLRDSEVINAAEKGGIAMYFTGIRSFYH